MEEKDSTESGSLGINSETESPPVSGGAVVAPLPVPVPQPQPLGLNMGLSNTGGGGLVPGGVGGEGVIGGGSSDLTMKKKRGRPRKYDADGNLRVGYTSKKIASPSPISQVLVSPPPGFSISHSPADYSSKKVRGRPPGSGNWQLLASLGELFAETAGGDFTPHVINVYTGEDVASKILSLFQKGPRGICVLSANGAVSNVTIRQPGSSGGILTYEGRFEILSLTGSYTLSENGGVKSRTGGLSVSLAGPDGRVIGGGIAGTLVAASPIQSVVGSFMPNGYKTHKRKHQYEPRAASAIQGTQDVTPARPISQAVPGINVTQILAPHFPIQNHIVEGMNTDNPYAVSNDTADWNGSVPRSDQRPSPDINLSAPDE